MPRPFVSCPLSDAPIPGGINFLDAAKGWRTGTRSDGHFGTGHKPPREKRVSRMTGSGSSRIQTSDQTKLMRGLRSRHVELIAIGGAIGVGLFLGSAKVIQNAGPGLILGYAVGGLVIENHQPADRVPQYEP